MTAVSFMLVFSDLLNLQETYTTVPEKLIYQGDLRTTNLGSPHSVLCWSSELSEESWILFYS